jgi:hypothetical protein
VYDTTGTVTGCTLNGIPQTVIGGGCNNAGLVSVLNSITPPIRRITAAR